MLTICCGFECIFRANSLLRCCYREKAKKSFRKLDNKIEKMMKKKMKEEEEIVLIKEPKSCEISETLNTSSFTDLSQEEDEGGGEKSGETDFSESGQDEMFDRVIDPTDTCINYTSPPESFEECLGGDDRKTYHHKDLLRLLPNRKQPFCLLCCLWWSGGIIKSIIIVIGIEVRSSVSLFLTIALVGKIESFVEGEWYVINKGIDNTFKTYFVYFTCIYMVIDLTFCFIWVNKHIISPFQTELILAGIKEWITYRILNGSALLFGLIFGLSCLFYNIWWTTGVDIFEFSIDGLYTVVMIVLPMFMLILQIIEVLKHDGVGSISTVKKIWSIELHLLFTKFPVVPVTILGSILGDYESVLSDYMFLISLLRSKDMGLESKRNEISHLPMDNIKKLSRDERIFLYLFFFGTQEEVQWSDHVLHEHPCQCIWWKEFLCGACRYRKSMKKSLKEYERKMMEEVIGRKEEELCEHVNEQDDDDDQQQEEEEEETMLYRQVKICEDFSEEFDDFATVTVKKNEIVDVIRKNWDWYLVRTEDGSEGHIPGTFVGVYEESEKGNKEKSSNLGVCLVMYDFEPEDSDEELRARDGDILTILEDDGTWMKCRNEECEEEGYIPVNFVKKIDI